MDAVTDELDRFVTAESFAITRHGYQRLLAWLQGPGEVIAVGVDGCRSWRRRAGHYLGAR